MIFVCRACVLTPFSRMKREGVYEPELVDVLAYRIMGGARDQSVNGICTLAFWSLQ